MIKIWLNYHFYDFVEDLELLKSLTKFMELEFQNDVHFSKWAEQLSVTIQEHVRT